MWLAVAVSIALVPLLLYLLGRAEEARVRQDWERLLSARGEELYERIAARWEDEMGRAFRSCAEARAARETGAIAEAMHLLDVGYHILEKSAPDLRRLLAGMMVFSRMARATLPPSSLAPERMRLRETARLVQLRDLVERALAGAAQRHRLRVYILERSFAVLARVLRDRIARVEGGGHTPDDWDQVEAASHDLGLLSREVLDAFAHLVRARERIESADLLWQLAERREQWRETPPTSTLVLWTALTCALLVVLAL